MSRLDHFIFVFVYGILVLSLRFNSIQKCFISSVLKLKLFSSVSVTIYFIWSFHLYMSKIIEKTRPNTSCLMRHRLVSFWLALVLVDKVNLTLLNCIKYTFTSLLYFMRLLVHVTSSKQLDKLI